MVLSTFNLYNYLLLRKWEKSISFLGLNIFSNNTKLLNLDPSNPHNTILKLEIDNQSLIFKQPKFLTSGATWQIIKENQFYDKFSDKLKDFIAEKIDFDETYNILILPTLDVYEIPSIKLIETSKINHEIIDFAKQSGEFIGNFHSKLRRNVDRRNIKRYPSEYSFIRDYISPFYAPYRLFFNSLRKGYKNAEYLDENVYKNLASIEIPIYKDLLYNFIWQDKINEPLNDFAISWTITDSFLIHGDLKVDNIYKENGQIKAIDFESVSKGDNAWDLIYFIDSVLTNPRFMNGVAYQHRHLFFHHCIKSYCENYMAIKKIEILKNNLLERVLKFWVIKKLMNMMSNKEGTKDLENNLVIIEKIITQNKTCIDAINDPDNNPDTIKLLFDYWH